MQLSVQLQMMMGINPYPNHTAENSRLVKPALNTAKGVTLQTHIPKQSFGLMTPNWDAAW